MSTEKDFKTTDKFLINETLNNDGLIVPKEPKDFKMTDSYLLNNTFENTQTALNSIIN